MNSLHALFRIALLVAGAGLVLFGIWFAMRPDFVMSIVDHTPDGLPAVMAGRYVFFGLMLLAAVLHGNARVLATLFAGFAFMGFWDAANYASTNPYPHLFAGVACIAVCAYYVFLRKEDQ